MFKTRKQIESLIKKQEYFYNLLLALARHLDIHPKELQKEAANYEDNMTYMIMMAKKGKKK